ncbi:uncharacterized protein METZ01_LOCUS165035 [marine metagenome]|uniref:Uncharacterized protein n=1 Tax=marine metagenome TaxID=408172 RepID=A0A382BFA8_9ZZZZ
MFPPLYFSEQNNINFEEILLVKFMTKKDGGVTIELFNLQLKT